VLSVGIAESPAERLAAARLVGRRYRDEGYLPELQDEHAAFYSSHHHLPQTSVFVTRENETITGTMTVVCDSPAGLPLEDLYGAEIRELRADRRHPCELCSLAVDPEAARRSPDLVLQLFRCAMGYLLHVTPTSDALITLKPAHAPFYQRRLHFQPFGAPTLDARFEFAPTVAMRLTREAVLNFSLWKKLN
jgi:hypothetical protein